ncbi:S-layer homology domain-containing protein [Paenibacillus arenilitoris]|uniref:S-layer homology domain-containing protein n=1 Tax=Paenibacillus arenilitoris TaxID=2772299 RepID=A0A927H4H4_9BACL|nr:S-layer homology domain-containing protein [Paenibacillus arenilitoris]MBD2867905.1 S-layer homology domain-containing protein [Paenibacillus arenilitoris]
MVKKMIVSMLAVTLMIGALGFTGPGGKEAVSAASEAPFSDIEKHWARENIIKASESGLVDGFPDGTFRPDAVVSADQFVSMMLRAFSDGNGKFDQGWLDALFYFQPAFAGDIKTATEKLGFKFENAKTGYWAKPYIDMLYEMSLLMTFDDVYPKKYDIYKKQLKRENASYLLGEWLFDYEGNEDVLYSEFVENNSGLKDFNSFTNSTVKIYRSSVLIAGVMNGYPNNYFYPHRYVTRAEALTMVQRLRDKSLRTPFKPNLTGKYYSEVDGRITLFSDKTKYEYYINFLKLANQHVTTGYKRELRNGVAIWDSKDSFEKNDFLIRIGDYESAPLPEFSIVVLPGTDRTISIMYPKVKSTKNSGAFQNAIFDLLVGAGKGDDLKSKLTKYEKTGDLINFKFNNKSFKFYGTGKQFILQMTY